MKRDVYSFILNSRYYNDYGKLARVISTVNHQRLETTPAIRDLHTRVPDLRFEYNDEHNYGYHNICFDILNDGTPYTYNHQHEKLVCGFSRNQIDAERQDYIEKGYRTI